MATIYGIDPYGAGVLGTAVTVEYDVSPFLAESIDYNSVALSWSLPQAAITEFRLVANRYGYSTSYDDGAVLVDSNYPPSSFVDTDVIAGTIKYYTIFVFLRGGWIRAGYTSCLCVQDQGYRDRAYNLLPSVYRTGVRAAQVDGVENIHLQQFMAVFGFGMDYLKTAYDTGQDVHDPDELSYEKLQLLAQDLGIAFQPAIPARLMRNRVKNSGHLSRLKGTTLGISGLMKTLSGWDVDITIGRNLLLNDDQGMFTYPAYDAYSSLLQYAIGDRVTFGNYVYEALLATLNIGPSGTATSTANWKSLSDSDYMSYINVTTLKPWYANILNPRTGNPSTWEGISLNGGDPGPNLGLASGLPSPIAGSPLVNTNAIFIRNNGTTAADFALRSVAKATGATSIDPEAAVTDGIPLRHAAENFDQTRTYYPGEIVLAGGRVYRAVVISLGVSPRPSIYDNSVIQGGSAGSIYDGTNADGGTPFTTATGSYDGGIPTSVYNVVSGSAVPEWEVLGIDNRIRRSLSGYTHQPFADATKATVAVHPYVDFYDETGNLVASVDGRTRPNIAYDSFSENWVDWATRILDIGSGTWETPFQNWTSSGFDNGVAYPTIGPGRFLALQTGQGDTQVAATFRTRPMGSLEQGVVFRYSDPNNYFRASRTVLVKKVAGVYTTITTFTTAFQNDDRMTVKMQGSTITVYRNGVSIFVGTDTFNQTATLHGMAVEASAA